MRLPIEIKRSVYFKSKSLVVEIRKVSKKNDWSINKTMVNLIKKGIEQELK